MLGSLSPFPLIYRFGLSLPFDFQFALSLPLDFPSFSLSYSSRKLQINWPSLVGRGTKFLLSSPVPSCALLRFASSSVASPRAFLCLAIFTLPWPFVPFLSFSLLFSPLLSFYALFCTLLWCSPLAVKRRISLCLVSKKPHLCLVSKKPHLCLVSKKPHLCLVSKKPHLCLVSKKPHLLKKKKVFSNAFKFSK